MDGHLPMASLRGHTQSTLVSHKEPVRRVGAVILDSHHGGQGWSCIPGRVPEKVKSLTSLSSDAIWWLGIPYKQFFERGLTAGSGNFRHDKWFNTGQDEVLREFGLSTGVAAGSTDVDALSRVAETVSRIAEQLAEACGMQTSTVLRPYSLSKGLASLLNHSPLVPEEFRARLEVGDSSPSFVRTAATSTGKRTVRFSRPRLAHAIEILNTPVPKGTVSWARPVPSDPMGEIRKAMEPVVADITITKAEPQRAGLYVFNQADKSGGLPRTTAAHPELLALDAFSVVHVHSLWAGDGYIRAIDTVPQPIRSFFRDPGCAVSWSAGVIAMEILRGMMAPQSTRGGGKAMTWRGVWLRATTRVISFSHAFSLSKAGFMPAAYGNGWMDVQIPDDPKLDIHLLTTALQLGYLPAAGAYSPDTLARAYLGEYGPAAPSGGWGFGRFMADTLLGGRSDLLRMADRAPLLDNDEQEVLFARLNREMRRSA